PASAGVPVAPAASSGISSNAAGALSYLLGLITGIVFLLVEPYKNNPFVRYHAFQSIFLNVAWIAFWVVWGIIGSMLTIVSKGLFAVIGVPIDLLIMLGG